MIKVIFFDQGGILLKDAQKDQIEDLMNHSGRDFHECKKIRKKYTAKLKLGLISDDEYWLGGDKYSELESGVLKELGIPKAKYQELRDNSVNFIKKFDFTEPMLKKLYPKYLLGIISNNTKDWGEKPLKSFDFEKYFQIIILSHQVGLAKPDKKIYELAQAKIGINIKPIEILCIDDKEKNLVPAAELGWNTIHFKEYNQLKRELAYFSVNLDQKPKSKLRMP